MLKHLLKIAIIVAAFLSMGLARASASDWPMYNNNPAGNGAVSDLSIINNQAATPRYLDVPSNTQDQIIAEGKLFYSDGKSASTVYAYDLATLTLAWSKTFPKQVARIVYTSGNIYLGADAFYSLRASDGVVNWSTPTGSASFSARVYTADNGRIYGFRFLSNTFYLMALDVSNGSILYNSTIAQIDNIADLLVSNDKIFSIANRTNNGGYYIRSWQKSDFTLITSVARNDTSTPTTVYDAATDQLYLTANDGLLNRFRASDLLLLDNFQTENMGRPVGYGSKYYAMWDKSLKSFTISTADHINLVKQNNLLPTGESFYQYADPIIVNGMLYAGTNKGNIWTKNLETGELKTYSIDTGLVVDRIIYGSQYFVIRGGYAGVSGKRFFIYNYANLGVKAEPAGFSIKSPYKTEGMNQYLGQTHAHDEPESITPNGQPWIDPPSPAEVETRYKNAGYSFIGLTEHNWLLPNPAVTGILHIENSEEITQDAGGDHILALGITSKIYPTGTDQERIDEVLMQGGVPILAHPNSKVYPFSFSAITSLDYLKHIEIFNNSLDALDILRLGHVFLGSAYSLDKWDTLSNNRKNIFGTGGDDYTPYDGGFDGAAVVVYATTDTQPDIMANLKSGNFYAVQGSKAPRINVDITGNTFIVTTDQSSTIAFIGKGGEQLVSTDNTNVASYLVKGDEIYVRAEIKSDDTGLITWTQALAIEPAQNISTASGGEHNLALAQAVIQSNTSGVVSAKTLDRVEFPESTPPLGYLSPIYELSTTGEVLDGNKLAISYTGKNLPVKAENLAVYNFDESSKHWARIPSTIDDANKIVTAGLPHYSLYTLSAEVPTDIEAPTISLSSPVDPSNLSGSVDLSVAASDNQAVTSVKFAIDDREIGYDILPADGWTASFNATDFISGSHKLTLIAEDFSGNTFEQNYDITIAGGITAPSVSVTTPVTTDYLYDPSNITGSYASQLALADIGIYLDDVYIDKADINTDDSTLNKNIDWSKFKEGTYKLKLELRDIKGNAAVVETDITVGQNITAAILSPQNKSYLRGGSIPITITTTPLNSAVNIYLDGTEVANTTTSLDLINYTIGNHNVEVKFRDKIIVSTTFIITTSYADTIKILKRFENEGRFKNNGISTAIIAQLRIAELAGKFGLKRIEKIALQATILFINQQAEGKKPKIDEWAKTKLIEQIDYLRDS